MRKASFVVQEADGAKVDISVTSFSGESGGLLANINRWRAQLGLDAVDAEQLESTTVGGRLPSDCVSDAKLPPTRRHGRSLNYRRYPVGGFSSRRWRSLAGV
jgi:hypothetical protein